MATSSVGLGLIPDKLQVNLTAGADFICTLRLNEDWPVGTAIQLDFPDLAVSAWGATISGTDAVFAVDKADSDAIPDSATVRLVYTNGTTDQVWAIGRVERRG